MIILSFSLFMICYQEDFLAHTNIFNMLGLYFIMFTSVVFVSSCWYITSLGIIAISILGIFYVQLRLLTIATVMLFMIALVVAAYLGERRMKREFELE